MIFIKFEILATAGFHGESSASSGSSATNSQGLALSPSFPSCLKVFFEDCGNQNELADSEKNRFEVTKASHFQGKPLKTSINPNMPTSSTLNPNYTI